MSVVVAMTGASGNMGQAVVREVMTLSFVRLRLLFLDEKRERRLKRKWQKRYRDRVEIRFGNVKDLDDCRWLVDGADYVVNMAAVIPPLADRRPDLARDANVTGVRNLVTAIEELPVQPKLIHISTVAIYGNRNYLHPWGRVGDPLLPSVYDEYGMGKLIGERIVLDSKVDTWAVLRQTGMLYEKLLMSNISDGLMFHTPFNVPIEWVTDRDSGVLIANILKADHERGAEEFWKNVYNIGGGAAYRTTGYETFDMGFAMIGGGTERFMRPNWHATRNFHCMWFSDSDVLERRFPFQSGSMADFWSEIKRKNRYFSLAKLLPPSWITALVFKRLLTDENAPYRWVKQGLEGRINAFFGSKDEWAAIGERWEDFPVWCKGGVDGHDYRSELEPAYADRCALSHGYDDKKPNGEIDLSDLKSAAAFRGGECKAASFDKGDLYTAVGWRCAEGHDFQSSPFTVLKAGHWCPHCVREGRWNFDLLAKKNPFYAQVWYDSHRQDENAVYWFDEDHAPRYEVTP
ncbi:MAG: NAD-dependent epimerase/dehydratase family protein [Clostridia bacterium]|nr:NAD-dependent epimerase/dehydratase family protein [Clostridia bacterium]